MAKEDATGQAVEPSMEQLLDINRKQSEIISAQARTIEELRGTIVELNASLAWLKRKVFGKMSEKCKPVDNGDPKLPFGLMPNTGCSTIAAPVTQMVTRVRFTKIEALGI